MFDLIIGLLIALCIAVLNKRTIALKRENDRLRSRIDSRASEIFSHVDKRVNTLQKNHQTAVENAQAFRKNVIGEPSPNKVSFIDMLLGPSCQEQPTITERLAGLEKHLNVDYRIKSETTRGYVPKVLPTATPVQTKRGRRSKKTA